MPISTDNISMKILKVLFLCLCLTVAGSLWSQEDVEANTPKAEKQLKKLPNKKSKNLPKLNKTRIAKFKKLLKKKKALKIRKDKRKIKKLVAMNAKKKK